MIWVTCADTASSSAATSTCRSRVPPSPTTARRGPASRPSAASPTRARPPSSSPTWSTPRAHPTRRRRRRRFANDTVGAEAQHIAAAIQDGESAVLENVRFNAAETSKDDDERGALADQLAALADVFVSDGFGAVHRKHASVYDVASRLPAAAG